MRRWMRDSNGWQRLWLALSIALLLYSVFINSFILASKNDPAAYEYQSQVLREYEDADCAAFWTKPINELEEPPFHLNQEKGCWHIYTTRFFNEEDVVPYTIEDYQDDFFWEIWNEIFAYAGFGAAVSIFLAVFIYFLGMVLVWIIQGFKKGRPSNT